MASPSELAFQRIWDEQRFREWYSQVARRMGLNPDPDDPGHHYDYRAAYWDMLRDGSDLSPQKAGEHFTSKYKTEGHPRTYLEDANRRVFNTKSGKYLTGEPVPDRQLRASEKSPDMPGFDDKTAANLMRVSPAILSLMRRGGL